MSSMFSYNFMLRCCRKQSIIQKMQVRFQKRSNFTSVSFFIIKGSLIHRLLPHVTLSACKELYVEFLKNPIIYKAHYVTSLKAINHRGTFLKTVLKINSVHFYISTFVIAWIITYAKWHIKVYSEQSNQWILTKYKIHHSKSHSFKWGSSLLGTRHTPWQ